MSQPALAAVDDPVIHGGCTQNVQQAEPSLIGRLLRWRKGGNQVLKGVDATSQKVMTGYSPLHALTLLRRRHRLDEGLVQWLQHAS